MAAVPESHPQHAVESDLEKIEHPNVSSASLDKAAVYLHRAQISGEGAVNSRELLWKIDRMIIPIAFVCYTMQFMDKINLNVSVGLSGNILCS